MDATKKPKSVVKILGLVKGAFGTLKTPADFTTLVARNPTDALAPFVIKNLFL